MVQFWCAWLVLGVAAAAMTARAEFETPLETILKHDDGQWLWFHPRAAAVPGQGKEGAPLIVLTLQKHLQISDYYGGLHYMLSEDLGKTWRGPMLPPELDWVKQPDGEVVSVCDVTPGWHAPSGKVLAIGTKIRYREGLPLLEKPRSHAAAYATYDPAADAWTAWKFVEMPEPEGKFYLVTPGCVQWLVENDGTLLVPFYFRGPREAPFGSAVMRCRFDGETLSYVEHGDELALAVERGLCEPSLAKVGATYYLTLRNDVKGYVTRSQDGLHFEPIQPWQFDDGEELGSYNTQQHWLTHGDTLYLVYTRRGANNDHVFRHRAPLFMAEVDKDKLCVLRSTERVLIPERGATLGNNGATAITPNESWVTVSEGVWDDSIRARGAEGATFVARVQWK
ncbi:MAG: exo-alpha-sialidase [Candidatus Hydrogenedentes bacterium]|nr:exo-alpha-sialidase [Candidatus Hydrogenedentota bacterium]